MQVGYPGAEILKTAGSFVIASHIHPDGDAIGSILGLGLALRGLGREVVILSAHPVPHLYSFLPGSELVKPAADVLRQLVSAANDPQSGCQDAGQETAAPAAAPASLKAKRFHCAVLLDCAGLDRVGKEITGIVDHCETLVNIDHHISNTRFGAINIVDAEASATGEIIYQILTSLRMGISAQAATNLYAAIASDTGYFQYQNTTSKCHLITSMLLDLGADHHRVHHYLNEHRTLPGIRLLEKGLSTLTLEHDGQIAWMALPRHLYAETGARLEDSDDFINYPKSIAGVEIGILFKEIDDHEVRVGFRSKSFADVNLLAARFDGGGHERASGCTVRGTLAEVEALVIGVAGDYLQKKKCERAT
jgi:phosphoesterase RecJ-like protein